MRNNKKHIQPQFNKNIPKDAARYFNPASDAVFKREHPLGYGLLVTIGIIALLLPMLIYIVFISVVYIAPESGWLMLGFAGAFIIGIGFFNIVAAWIHQYLGHLVTALCLGIGSLMVAASCLFVYSDALYNSINQEMVTYYFLVLLFLLLPVFFYFLFRIGIDDWLQAQKIGKSHTRKLKKGKKNYWWYEKIQETVDMGWLYNVNKIFTIMYPVTFVIHLLLGWVRAITIPVFIAVAAIDCLSAVMILFSRMQYNLAYHKQPIIIFAKSDNNGIDSFLLDLGMAAFPVVMAYTNFLMIKSLWS